MLQPVFANSLGVQSKKLHDGITPPLRREFEAGPGQTLLTDARHHSCGFASAVVDHLLLVHQRADDDLLRRQATLIPLHDHRGCSDIMYTEVVGRDVVCKRCHERLLLKVLQQGCMQCGAMRYLTSKVGKPKLDKTTNPKSRHRAWLECCNWLQDVIAR